MAQVHVLVLSGGNSDEREVSLRTGNSISAALIEAGHRVTNLEPGISAHSLLQQTADVIFPALHGRGGEDGSLQAFCEEHYLRFVGSGSGASKLGFYKYDYAQFLAKHNILVPETELVDYEGYRESALSQRPHVLKPSDGGSSIDTFIVRHIPTPHSDDIEKAFMRRNTMLLQSLIMGREITVGVLGNEALPVVEIILPEGEDFDYQNKYNDAAQELCPPHNVSVNEQDAARQLALRIHRLIGCRHLSRTDMIITERGDIYVLETNTIPGLTEQSVFPKAAAAVDILMPELSDRLVNLALAH